MLVIDRRAPRGRRRRVGARRITRVRGTGVSCPKRPPRLSQRSATGVASTSRHSAPAKSATGPTSSSRRAAHTRTRCRSNRLQSGRASRPTSPRSVAQSSGATRCSRVVSLSIGRTRNGSRPGCRRTTPTPSVAASSTYTSGAARRSPHIFASHSIRAAMPSRQRRSTAMRQCSGTTRRDATKARRWSACSTRPEESSTSPSPRTRASI